MTKTLQEHFFEIRSQRSPLWIDAADYGQQLLAKGKPTPWSDVGEFIAYQRQLQGLVQSDVVVVNLGEFYVHWLQEHPELIAAMAAKSRLGYALRTLLADNAARAHILEIVTALCECYTDRPVILAMPSPRQWIASAYCSAKQVDEVDVSWEAAESAAIYMADFLRTFADCALKGLLLQDEDGCGPACDLELTRYQPVINVADHYRWQLVLAGCANNYRPSEDQGVTYVIHNQDEFSGGRLFPADSWKTESLPGMMAPEFWYMTIPVDAVPETVLDVLDELRN